MQKDAWRFAQMVYEPARVILRLNESIELIGVLGRWLPRHKTPIKSRSQLFGRACMRFFACMFVQTPSLCKEI